MSQTLRFVLFSQLCLAFFSIICIAIKPYFLFELNEGGLSNYGRYATTVVPYSLASLLCGSYLIAAAESIKNASKPKTKLLKYALFILGLEYIILLASTYTYKTNYVIDLIHIVAAIVIFISEISLGLWLSLVILHTFKDYCLGILLIVAFLSLLLTYVGLLHVLFVGEICSSVAFGILLYDGTSLVIESATEP